MTATDADAGDTLEYKLGLNDPLKHYPLFEVATTGQLTVSVGGANDTSGLDADQVYPVVLTVMDGVGWLDSVIVAVQLDTTNESPSGDGLCP